MTIYLFIPARYHSSRLPGKPLLKINNKTIINHVYENVIKIKNIDNIVILTDDIRIKEECNSFNAQCEIINEECLNGTDRIIKYLQINNINDGIIVNVQGDEPFIKPENIEMAINNFIDKKKIDTKLVCSSLYYETTDLNEIKSRSRGKTVLDKNNNVMYCSRNIIPSSKTNKLIPNYKYKIHVGIFVFDCHYLLNHYIKENTNLQLEEDIEWMKILEQGYKMNCVQIKSHEIGVDTIDDYNYLKNKYE
jgi:3-deoxy-manno-octulosonate cytidylyltransferase (CMP-KDO synthetase)